MLYVLIFTVKSVLLINMKIHKNSNLFHLTINATRNSFDYKALFTLDFIGKSMLISRNGLISSNHLIEPVQIFLLSYNFLSYCFCCVETSKSSNNFSLLRLSLHSFANTVSNLLEVFIRFTNSINYSKGHLFKFKVFISHTLEENTGLNNFSEFDEI